MSSSSSKTIILKSSDSKTVEVDMLVAMRSETLKNIYEPNSDDGNIILIPNISGKTLEKVMEYCKRHTDPVDGGEKSLPDENLKAFDAEFVKADHKTLCDLVLAANFLNIKSLMGLLCQAIANVWVTKSPEELRQMLNIKNDFTP